MPKISIDDSLFERAKKAATKEGYSSLQEFVEHALETELKRTETDHAEQQVEDQLRGLGYIE
jgi:metal-responsive CopG/Arc/MetJ family transcriptional regulator